MKKPAILLLTIALVLSSVACGGNGDADTFATQGADHGAVFTAYPRWEIF